jgi:hypothetical protein
MLLLTLALLAQRPVSQAFPEVARGDTDRRTVVNVQALCHPVNPGDATSLLAEESREGEAAVAANSPATWLALACTRAELYTLQVRDRTGPLMRKGDSWAQGAITTVLKVLELHPGDRKAADLLSVFAMEESDRKALQQVVQRLDDAVTAGANGGPTLRACAELGLRVGRPALARHCAEVALAAGHDSTEQLLMLAQLAASEHDTAATAADFIGAAAAAHDTLAKLAVTWHLQWFVTPDEQRTWSTLPDSGRGVWVRDRLASREVRDGQPDGARVVEHFTRLAYADSAFRLKVSSRMRNTLMHGASMESTSTDPDFPDTWRDYSRWQTELDDRGATWMRFGPPLKRVFREQPPPRTSSGRTVAGGETTAFEAWLYEIDGRRLVLTFVYEPFSGQVGPSRLVSGNVGDLYCGLDAERCAVGQRRSITADVRQRIREEDREDILEATTKDDNSPRGDKEIELVARLHRLWDPASGNPLALVTYAVKTADLSVQKGSGGSRTALLDLDLRRWDGIDNRWRDTSVARHLTLPDGDLKRTHLTGFLVTPSSGNVTAWSLVATQPDKLRGRMWDERTPPLDRRALALSDLVLGEAGQGLAWTIGGEEVPLAPLNAVDRARPMSLYYQLQSDRVRPALTVTVLLYRVDDGVARDSAALRVASGQRVVAGVNAVARTLDLSRLDHGSYLLEVQVADERGMIVTRRSVALNLD